MLKNHLKSKEWFKPKSKSYVILPEITLGKHSELKILRIIKIEYVMVVQRNKSALKF